MMYSKFHLNLRRLRHDYGLTQEEFGEILNLTKSQISLYEKGISRPNTDLLTRIAQYFNVPLTQLIETSIRHDFYFREVVTGRNITIQLPAEKGVENLIGVPGLLRFRSRRILEIFTLTIVIFLNMQILCFYIRKKKKIVL